MSEVQYDLSDMNEDLMNDRKLSLYVLRCKDCDTQTSGFYKSPDLAKWESKREKCKRCKSHNMYIVIVCYENALDYSIALMGARG